MSSDPDKLKMKIAMRSAISELPTASADVLTAMLDSLAGGVPMNIRVLAAEAGLSYSAYYERVGRALLQLRTALEKDPATREYLDRLTKTTPSRTELDRDAELTLEFEIPMEASDSEVADALVEAAEMADDLHRSMGGHGLQVKDVGIYDMAEAPEVSNV
ncbi:MAG: hypothetical protein HQ518_11350 [Rhodopirellula sp.]|nr:hypothetical protein [Rhodopirellula sp.]